MQSSSNPLRTLKGIFEVPRMNHRRDFLRENKLNLRELQKNTTHKLSQQKLEQEKQEMKYLKRNPKADEQHIVGKRSNSQQRFNGEDLRQPGGRDNMTDRGRPVEAGKPMPKSYRRSYSLHREAREIEQQSSSSFDNYNNHHHSEVKEAKMPPRSASVASVISKADSCDKEIQTEDILDEEFLYDALKKCSSTETSFRNRNVQDEHYKQSAGGAPNIKQTEQQVRSEDNRSTHSREHIQYDYRDRVVLEENKSCHDQCVEQSGCHHMHNGLNRMARDDQHYQENEHLEDDVQHLYINPRANDAPLSARSRQSIASIASKNKTNGSIKMGNRDDVRLPRYLEKEKREREEELLRERSRDPNCPVGHHVMEEGERMAALNGAQKKMAALIQELNRMPMTSETLRIRTRKREIEKDLSQIELDIRAFSKSKCYVVTDPTAATSQY